MTWIEEAKKRVEEAAMPEGVVVSQAYGRIMAAREYVATADAPRALELLEEAEGRGNEHLRNCVHGDCGECNFWRSWLSKVKGETNA